MVRYFFGKLRFSNILIDYSIILVSPLSRYILDYLQTLVAQLESHLGEESYNLVILVLLLLMIELVMQIILMKNTKIKTVV